MQSLSSTETPPTSRDKPRRPSIASLPAISLLHRRDEDPGSPVPYVDGPVQVIPGVWIGSEDNARDWGGLLERRIRSILNVAKEVASPFDAFPASQALRSSISTPDFRSRAESDPMYYPPHVPSGRPGMHYLKLDWSHGQQDLVNHGFKDGMAFVDAALERGEGCLIQYDLRCLSRCTMINHLLTQLSMWHLSLSHYGYCTGDACSS
jgi:tyrosine-protein phosphatase